MPEAFVYVLKSERNERFYVGWTTNVAARFEAHNAGRVKATCYLRPWQVVYVEKHGTATDARKREWQLKRMKSRVFIEVLIEAG